MKINKNTWLLLVAAIFFGAAIKIALLGQDWQHRLIDAHRKLFAAQVRMDNARNVRKIVFATIPAGNGHLDNLETELARGGVALYQLALDSHLIVGLLTIKSSAQGDISLSAVEKPLPMTNDTISRIDFLLKANFNNLSDLSDFVKKIPETGGYLSNISIKDGEAALTIKFIGI
ncbi:MAG: hypothetical protein ACYCSZ_04625 [Burkholderiales bacterium]